MRKMMIFAIAAAVLITMAGAAAGWAAAFLGFALSCGATLIGFDHRLKRRPAAA